MTAFGLAIFSAIAAVRTSALLAASAPPGSTRAAPGQVPAPELADPPSSTATPRRPAANR